MNTSTTRYLEFHAAAYYSNLPTCEDYWIFIDNANKITHIWNSDDEMLKWVDEWMYSDPQFGGTIIGKNNSIYCLTRKWHITPERIEFIDGHDNFPELTKRSTYDHDGYHHSAHIDYVAPDTLGVVESDTVIRVQRDEDPEIPF